MTKEDLWDKSEEELFMMYAHAEISTVQTMLLEKGASPLQIAGIMMAAASRIYQQIMTKEEFQDLMDCVKESTIDGFDPESFTMNRTVH